MYIHTQITTLVDVVYSIVHTDIIMCIMYHVYREVEGPVVAPPILIRVVVLAFLLLLRLRFSLD